MNPAPLGHPDLAAWDPNPANYDDDLERLRGCDLVIEAIAERMDWKHDLYAKVAPFVRADAIFASNTSGLSIGRLSEGFAAGAARPVLRRALLQSAALHAPGRTDRHARHRSDGARHARDIPDHDAGQGLRPCQGHAQLHRQPDRHLQMFATVREAEKFGLAFDVVDDLTGAKLGRAKSGTFRTADIVGLDTIGHVMKTMQDHLPDDPFRPLYDDAGGVRGADRQGRARPEDRRRLLPQGRQGHPAFRSGQGRLRARPGARPTRP
jgi:3-hydroxyacyl-CoA dehydrogenase